MCGIAGIFRSEGNVTTPELKKLSDVLSHRGPDGEGQWLSNNMKLGLSHRRLSIIDLSMNARQPMSIDGGRFTIVFNGEIYNYKELKEEMEQKGIKFFSTSDTEVLLNLYKLKREKCLQEIDGMFAFAIWDEVEQNLFCARDRFGEKPFFYHYVPNHLFVFASEIKAIHKYGIPKQPNEALTYHFFQLNYRLGNANDKSETFFSNIKKLPNASYLIVSKDIQININKYWDIDWRNQHEFFDEKVATKNIRELFNESIRRRLRSDVPIGSSLSGGLDSSGIVCWIDKYFKNELKIQKTFSARFENHPKDEGKFMQMVIDSTEVEPHFTWPDASKLLDNIDDLYYHQDEPFASTSMFAQWEVMKLAKENDVKVLIDGQGADEVFAGYHPYYRLYINRLYKKDIKLYQHELAVFNNIHDSQYRGYLKHNWRYHLSALKGNLLKKVSGDPSLFDKMFEFSYRNTNYNMETPVNLNHNLYLSLLCGNGLEDLLRYGDRNSMAFSREVRLPFLYHKLVEFVFTLPDSFKLRDGWTKFIFRKSIEDITPPGITWRRDKIGYETPQNNWLESKMVYEYLDSYYQLLVKHHILNKALTREQKLNVGWQIIMAGKLFS
ncbi:MAG: asparagine synthase (glutamine-hydrolyzing) [Chitinophagaceae bacterium]|nr:asparagine synthase (glutamine-hydrolyzing) [Chitinophagaceae bacterium]